MGSTLYHFTCEHGHAGLLADRYVRSPVELVERAYLVRVLRTGDQKLRTLLSLAWFTDLDEPIADALGLTRNTIACDRTQYRWRAEPPEPGGPVPYLQVRAALPRIATAELEAAPGAMPRHWFVAFQPIPAVHDPWRRERRTA